MAENLNDRGKNCAASLCRPSRLLIIGFVVLVRIDVVWDVILILSIWLTRSMLRSITLPHVLRLCGLIFLMISALFLHGTIVVRRALVYLRICLILCLDSGQVMKLGVPVKLFWNFCIIL